MESDSGIKLKSLKVDGGASNNDFLMQFQSDVMNAPVRRPKCIETTAMGAAYLAGLAIGFWKSKEDVMKQWVIDKEFNVKMDENERKKQLDGWNQAVKCSFGWSKNE